EGYLIEKKEKSGKVWKYEWNTAGMLQRVVRPDKAEVHFKYDALGRRLEKQYKKTITKFIWDGNKPLHEWKEFDAKEATADEIITWVFNEDDFAPTAKIKGEKKYSIVTDHLGTPVQGYNETGELIWDRELDSYGKIRMLKGDEGFCNYLYQGQTLDAETGLAYNRFRYYDPEEGIYVSQDPIGIEGGLQFYNYVDDPNTYIDEFGLLERPYIRKGTRQTIESRGKVRRGRFLDPNTGKPIPGDKRRSYSRAKGEYDIGHKTGHEHWRLVKEAKKRKYTQQQFNNWVNKNPQWFQVEDPNENQSHKHEKKRKTATYKRI
ncbi:MAG TPA: RHS repeat-associated core domain-containing protein, partial [Bacteroidia bacterium]|nr:RHS repeat-associated core domain-containing protein [Bacteroidia bacterium]HRG54291.1 RHS repeat-associated core domain-containing protein [Bacteroidia bacterium]